MIEKKKIDILINLVFAEDAQFVQDFHDVINIMQYRFEQDKDILMGDYIYDLYKFFLETYKKNVEIFYYEATFFLRDLYFIVLIIEYYYDTYRFSNEIRKIRDEMSFNKHLVFDDMDFVDKFEQDILLLDMKIYYQLLERAKESNADLEYNYWKKDKWLELIMLELSLVVADCKQKGKFKVESFIDFAELEAVKEIIERQSDYSKEIEKRRDFGKKILGDEPYIYTVWNQLIVFVDTLTNYFIEK